jgi:hypothetical protein
LSRLRAKDPKAAEPSKPKVLIFGRPGVGKTWTAIDFPGVYYVDTEGGANLSHYTDKLAKSSGVYLGPEDGACEFKTVLEQIKALATEKHPYRTLVIDSISKLFNTAVALEADRLGDSNAYGADKKPAVAAMRQIVAWLERLDMNVILIAHEKEEWGARRNKKGDMERVVVGQTFDCWEKLEYELHLALRIMKDDKSGKRTATVRKTRLTGFPEGDVFPWSYAAFAERYGKDIIEGAVNTLQLATPEQVTEVQRLIGAVKVDEDFVQKCFAKAGADRWEDLDTVQIQKTIDWLKGRIAA